MIGGQTFVPDELYKKRSADYVRLTTEYIKRQGPAYSTSGYSYYEKKLFTDLTKSMFRGFFQGIRSGRYKDVFTDVRKIAIERYPYLEMNTLWGSRDFGVFYDAYTGLVPYRHVVYTYARRYCEIHASAQNAAYAIITGYDENPWTVDPLYAWAREVLDA